VQRHPRLVVVAGPNGVGKSTYSRSAFATGFLLLDPDRYGINPNVHDPITAGRLVVSRVHEALNNEEDVVLETTLSGQFPIKILRVARRAGYDITLLYVGVNDASECVRRVRNRVSHGGHDVPEADIRRRFERSINALPKAVEYADRVTLYDNAPDREYRLIVQSEGSFLAVVRDVPAWAEGTVAFLTARQG
jgi:predicted ABC-type ATPase